MALKSAVFAPMPSASARRARGRQLRDVLQQCCSVGLDRTGAVAGYRPTGGGTCGCSVSSTRDE